MSHYPQTTLLLTYSWVWRMVEVLQPSHTVQYDMIGLQSGGADFALIGLGLMMVERKIGYRKPSIGSVQAESESIIVMLVLLCTMHSVFRVSLDHHDVSVF